MSSRNNWQLANHSIHTFATHMNSDIFVRFSQGPRCQVCANVFKYFNIKWSFAFYASSKCCGGNTIIIHAGPGPPYTVTVLKIITWPLHVSLYIPNRILNLRIWITTYVYRVVDHSYYLLPSADREDMLVLWDTQQSTINRQNIVKVMLMGWSKYYSTTMYVTICWPYLLSCIPCVISHW